MDNPSMKLSELLEQYENISDDAEKTKQQRNVFMCLDMELMDLHEKGYTVTSFDPKDITMFPHGVKYNSVEKGNDDASIRQNLYDNALLGTKMYLNYYDNVDTDFIKQHFSEIEFAFPKDDVRYFKGVLVNGLKVYFNEYDSERKQRDMAKLKEYAYVPFFSFGLIITIVGCMTCLFAILYGILLK